MKKILKSLFRKFGLEITRYLPDKNKKDFVSLRPERESKGNMLLSFILDPFLLQGGEPVSNVHTHDWESLQIAQTFLDLGYSVDVIHYMNSTFVPQKQYSFFVGARTNFQRISQLLNSDCFKIVHLDTSHWLFNNTAAYKRCLALQQRRGVTVKSFKLVEPNWAIEYADFATIKGNRFTSDTYAYANKPFYNTYNPACVLFHMPENKNFERCKKNFLWFGSKGLVHKGLDLVLEAFVDMPDYHLTICCPIDKEKDFENAYYKELYETRNIHTLGWIDISSPEFTEVKDQCVGLIYPSCAEGQAGSVINCLQAGLIPILSRESGIDVYDFGLILKECSINEIKKAIIHVSNLPSKKLKIMSQKAWEYARSKHSRESFAVEYRKIIENIIDNKTIKNFSKYSKNNC